jgi:serine/threonine protein kinase/tetratricopeptide (TPR) repeat protein
MDIIEAPSPEVIGPYRVLRSIAQGGMAAVFEAQDEKTGRRVAVKLLTHRGLARPRFAREYRALTRLDHPNIVRVYRYGLHEGNPYLSMELVEGDAIQVYAKSLGVPGSRKRTRQVTRVLAEVADALQYLHDRAIVHRDLKSSNILILRDGRAKLLDFGTARYLSGAEAVTRQGEFVGTFAYASPEQITGGHVDGRSDLYSMGVLLYRLLTGRRPFQADTPHALAKLHVEHRPPPPSKLVPKVPKALDELVMRLLEKDPADRPDSAAAVAEYLRGQSEGRSTREVPLGPGRLVGREDLFDALRDKLSQPDPGDLLLVVGAEGSGRARMMRTAIASARQMGLRSFGGNFGGERGIGIFSEIIEDVRSSMEGQEIPIESQAWNEIRMSAPSRLESVYLDMVEVLAHRAKADSSPVVVGLGDLHRASPSALDALAYVRQKLKDLELPVVFLCSAPEDSAAVGTALHKRFPGAHRFDLKPLSAHQVRDLTTSILGGRPLSREICQRIFRVTGGLPGFVGEVLRAMVQGGVLSPVVTQEGVVWEERAEGALSIPATAKEAIGLRIDGLALPFTRLLEALAVAGGESSTRALAFALERQEDTIVVDLTALGALRLIASRDTANGEIWRFNLDLTKELVLQRLRPMRQAVFQDRLAQAVRNDPPGKSKILLLVAAGLVDEALVDTVTWAAPLVEWHRAEEALPVLVRVVGVVSGAREVDRTCLCQLYLLLGRARLSMRAGNRQAESDLQRASALAPTDSLRAEVELYRARGLSSRGSLKEARKLLERSLSRLAGEPTRLQALVAMELGGLFWYLGQFDKATAQMEQALQSSRKAHWNRIVARALAGRGVIRLCRGLFTGAEQDLREAIDAFALLGDRSSMWHCQGNLCDILRRKGRFSEAITLLESELPDLREGGGWTRQALFVLNLAETEVELLRLGRARERIQGLAGDMDLQEHLHLRSAVALLQGRIFLISGEPDRAQAVLEPMLENSAKAGVHIVSAQLQALLGEARVKNGQNSLGIEDLAQAIQTLQEQGHLPSLGEACAARARAMSDREDPDLSFGPVLHWMEQEPVSLLRMEYLLASARYAESCNKRARAQNFWLEAQALYNTISKELNEGEREALIVHPWTVAIQAGLQK